MPEPPEFVKKEADAADALAEAYRRDAVLALLGPAREPYLSWRTHAQRVLDENGYVAHVMETYPDARRGELLREKWERMLRVEKPTHFFIVVPRNEPMRGAHVEFGYLCASTVCASCSTASASSWRRGRTRRRRLRDTRPNSSASWASTGSRTRISSRDAWRAAWTTSCTG